MSKLTKLYVGSYLIMRDYAAGIFPPKFEDAAQTYEGELNYHTTLPGIPEAESRRRDMCKPFGPHFPTSDYLRHLSTLLETLDKLGVARKAKLLELGCGEGWMAECLALSGFDVHATSISPADIKEGSKRIEAVRVKDADARLQFRASPMESIHSHVEDLIPLDVVFVYEALHHAFCWKTTFGSVFQCLAPGGWFLICNEPNVLHTFVSYRVARLSNTHEIGLSRRKMVKSLADSGFTDVRILENRLNNGVRPHWIAAQKP